MVTFYALGVGGLAIYTHEKNAVIGMGLEF